MTTAPDSAAAQAAPENEADAPKGGVAHDMVELAKTVIYALLIALILRVVLFQPFTIPSASMEPTLLEGDYIIVSKFAYGWSRDSIPFAPPLFKGRIFGREPHRGDIIVFKLPRDGHTDYIKRLVGLPGDRIQVLNGVVNINGQPVVHTKEAPGMMQDAYGDPRPVVRYHDALGAHSFTSYSFNTSSPAENTGVFNVPKGCYFMMGDNRDDSLDSRFLPGIDQSASCPGGAAAPFLADQLGVGFVPAENLVGKADIILFSWKQGQVSLVKPWTWFTTARWNRFFHLLH